MLKKKIHYPRLWVDQMGVHVVNTGQMRNAYNVLVHKSEEAEPFGRNMSR
jgi:hypothetical protein